MAKANADTLARGLGWFSLALGTAELVAPSMVSRAAGMAGRERLIQAYGLREIAAGAALLAAGDKRPWVLARLAGDGLDLATLASGAVRQDGAERRKAAFALAATAAVTAADLACARELARERRPEKAWDYSDRSGFPQAPDRMRGTVKS